MIDETVAPPADTYVALSKSRTVADGLIDRFNLMTVYDPKVRQEARKELEKRTAVSTDEDGLIKNEVDDKDPDASGKLSRITSVFRRLYPGKR